MTQTTKEIADQDIVERLREFEATDCCSQRKEAAYEIEQLRKDLNTKKLAIGALVHAYDNEWKVGDAMVRARKIMADGYDPWVEIERLRGALRTIDSLIPKTKEITDLPYWVAIAGDIAEGALNGTWPAYGVMPAPAKRKE